ncbi:hypothetical protein ACKWTF_008839 [Chironomus riparius]
MNEETDVRTEQSLELFKNWLAKHPFIKYDGDDNIDDFLMYFLRMKKFNMDQTYESFEFAAKFVKSRPQFYENPGPHDYEFTSKPKSPVVFVKKRDSQGRRIYIYRIKHFESFKDVKFFRNVFLTPFFMSFVLETQINGIVIIVDFRDIDRSKSRKVSLETVFDAGRVAKIAGSKMKQFNFIGMPGFFRPLFEIAKTFTSAKVISRINFLQNVGELEKVMDVSILPKEYGGSADDFLDFSEFEEGIKYVNQFNKFNVNFAKIQEFEGVGSFRKLEID